MKTRWFPVMCGTILLAAAVPTGVSAQGNQFTMAQTLSDGAQSTTIAFDGLGFLTGNLGSDSFFPPGKVADYWGFQYLRDNDPSVMGHNTDFLTRASLNMLNVLTPAQRDQLAALARSQLASISEYGYRRLLLSQAFRRLLEGSLPSAAKGLDRDAVVRYSAELYTLDGQMSWERARVMGAVLTSLGPGQRAYLAKMVGKGMKSWPEVTEPEGLRGYGNDFLTAMMTYAGDMYAWYAGSVEADVYFCPERQGTYFGSFYLKDAPAVGNAGYNIGLNITADIGKAFLGALTPAQARLVTALVGAEKQDLAQIVEVRKSVSLELRKFIAGQTGDQQAVLRLSERYGELDGDLVYRFAVAFAQVGQTLTNDQKTKLAELRKKTIGTLTPKGAYLYATEIALPELPSTDFLFGVGNEPSSEIAGFLAAQAAQASQQAAAKGPAPRSDIGGRVKSVDGFTVVLENPKGDTVQILATDKTLVQAEGSPGQWDSVAEGKSVRVTGARHDDGSWTATKIEVFERPPARPEDEAPPPPPAEEGQP